MESKRQKKRVKATDEEVEEPSYKETEDVIEDTTDKQPKSEKKKRRKVENSEKALEEAVAAQPESTNTSTELFLSGFPFDTDIQAYVMEHTKGVIEVRVHKWHDTGRSRGCAHVEYDSEESMEEAKNILHKAEVGSRYIVAEIAKPKDSKALAPPPKEDSSRGGRRIFVKNLPYEINEEKLRNLFRRFGAVKHARLPQWNHTENKKGFGYIEFEQMSMAVECMKSHREKPLEVDGRVLQMDYDQGKPKRGFKDEKGRAWYKPKLDAAKGSQRKRK